MIIIVFFIQPKYHFLGKRDDEEETKEDKELTEAEPRVQDEEG